MSGIRVLLADDHGLFREGLRLILESQPDIAVVAEASTAAETIEACKKSEPDVVLVGVGSPSESAAITASLVRDCRAQRVLALALDAGEAELATLVRAGALGCGLKGWSSADLVAAVRAVYRGAAYLDSSALRGVLAGRKGYPAVVQAQKTCGLDVPTEIVNGQHRFELTPRRENHAGEGKPDAAPRLNDRERDTVALLAEGRTSEEAAKTLGLRIEDVETYKAHAMEKLEARNRAQLVRYAMRRGFRFE